MLWGTTFMANATLQSVLHQLRRLAAPEGAGALTDAQLLRRVVEARDAAAFEVLVWRHGPLVLGACRKLLGHAQDAEDAFQATFLVLARKAASVARSKSLAGWLHRVACRIAFRLRAQARKRQTRERHDLDLSAAAARNDDVAEVEAREQWAVLVEELHRLPARYRLPLIACYLQGKTQEEAARELNRPLGSMSRHLARGCELLRARLTRRGAGLPSAAGLAALLSAKVHAALSASLVLPTVTAALEFSAGAVVSSPAAALANGAIQSMIVSKLKAVAGLVLVLSVLAAGTAGLAHPVQVQPPVQPKLPEKVAEQPRPAAEKTTRLDIHGDPLPKGALARLGTLRLRHGGDIKSVAFTPDGKQLLAHGHYDGVRVWDVATGREVQNLLRQRVRQRDMGIIASALAPDGKTVVALERDQDRSFVRLRHLADLKPQREFAVNQPQDLRLSPDGKVVALLEKDGKTIEVWDLSGGKKVCSWKADEEHVWCYVFSADSKTLVTGGADKAICFWDVATGGKKQELAGHPNNVGRIALSPDGSLLASLDLTKVTTGGGGATYLWNDFIRVWDVASGKEARRLVMPQQKDVAEFQRVFSNVTFSPDGKTLVTAGSDGQLRFWDPATGKELRRFAVPGLTMAFSADGKTLAAAGEAISLINVADGKEILPLEGHKHHVTGTVLTQDGRTVATTGSGNREVMLWDPTTGRLRGKLDGHESVVIRIIRCDDGTLFSWGLDKTVRSWDLATGKQKNRLDIPGNDVNDINLLAVSSDGKTLASREGKTVSLTDAATGKEVCALEHDGWVQGAAFSPDNRTLTAWSVDHTAHVWDLARVQKLRQWEFIGGGGIGFGYSAAASPDGKLIAFGSRGRFVALHEIATGKVVRRLEDLPDGVAELGFSADSRVLAWSGYRDPTIHLVEVVTGRERYALTGHKGRISSLAFSADGKTLITGSEDTTALVWDLTGRLRDKEEWGKPLTAADLDGCWADLSDDDAARAYRAIQKLAGSPKDAVPYLQRRLQPAPAVDEKRVRKLIADLGSEDFGTRENARKELEKFGEGALDLYRKALAGKPSAEARRQLEALAERYAEPWVSPWPELVRSLRALEALELIGTPEARKVLETIAKGVPGARLKEEAKQSLERLNHRPQ
jgi:RNA polymerase sigma factor (sigma-70 family)